MPDYDPLLEWFSNEEMDTVWVPATRATTELGAIRQAFRFWRAAGADMYDVTIASCKVERRWAIVTEKDGWCGNGRYLDTHLYPDDWVGGPVPRVEESTPDAELWWQVTA